MKSSNPNEKKAMSLREIAEQIRKDMSVVIQGALRGETVTRTVTVWEGGQKVTKFLSGKELIEMMKQIENDVIWEDVRRRLSESGTHPLEKAAASA